jgi:hypothetical protein
LSNAQPLAPFVTEIEYCPDMSTGAGGLVSNEFPQATTKRATSLVAVVTPRSLKRTFTA